MFVNHTVRSPLFAKGAAILLVLLAANIICWCAALVLFRESPLLMGTALLAYTLGLRHAVDADHIAAIDNVTRNMMQAGARPLTVGLFFSLGHSSIVILASAALAVAMQATEGKLEAIKDIGGVIGTSVSAVFLIAVGAINLVTLVSIWRRLRRSRSGEPLTEAELSPSFGGPFGRVIGSRFRLITKSWQMYPLGFLFGLGFDTASEITLLGIAAHQGSQGLPLLWIMIFPALFTAGMSLIDTLDGYLMVGAYGWALQEPNRRLQYNFAVTLLSVVVAIGIGGIEALHLIGEKLTLDGRFWQGLNFAAEGLGSVGYAVIAAFILIWIVSYLSFRARA